MNSILSKLLEELGDWESPGAVADVADVVSALVKLGISEDAAIRAALSIIGITSGVYGD